MQPALFPCCRGQSVCLSLCSRPTPAPKVCVHCHGLHTFRQSPHMQCCAVCCSAAHEACPLRRCPSRLFSRKTEAPALKKGGRPGSSRREPRWGRLAKVHQWWTRVPDRAPLTQRERVARHERTGHELFSSSNKLRRRLSALGVVLEP